MLFISIHIIPENLKKLCRKPSELCAFVSELLNRLLSYNTLSCSTGMRSCYVKHRNFFESSFFATKNYKNILLTFMQRFWKVVFNSSSTLRIIYFWIEQPTLFTVHRTAVAACATHLPKQFDLGWVSCCVENKTFFMLSLLQTNFARMFFL